jgi:hypothetical protein
MATVLSSLVVEANEKLMKDLHNLPLNSWADGRQHRDSTSTGASTGNPPGNAGMRPGRQGRLTNGSTFAAREVFDGIKELMQAAATFWDDDHNSPSPTKPAPKPDETRQKSPPPQLPPPRRDGGPRQGSAMMARGGDAEARRSRTSMKQQTPMQALVANRIAELREEPEKLLALRREIDASRTESRTLRSNIAAVGLPPTGCEL